jgi:predicted Zn-ribbon and HTH transcriptional regulator
MSTTRPKLQLDEQSFQRLLAAAFTIQEHGDLLKQVTQVDPKLAREPETEAPRICRHCGVPLKKDESRCGRCGSEEFRSGERMQHKFASLWERSQDHGVHQEHPPKSGEESVFELASSARAMAPEPANQSPESRPSRHDEPAKETEWGMDRPIDVEHTLLSPPLETIEDSYLPEAQNPSDRSWKALSDLRQLFSRRRADLYLGIAVLLAILAFLWPAPAAPYKPRLEPWQRVLITLGIAEAPPSPIHYSGNPNIEVWVDPHTALYYCPGDEPYGKVADGRLTSQREAQADQFQPANRAACN